MHLPSYMKGLKILLCAPHIKISGVGGAATHHTEFAKALVKLGVEVHMLVDCEREGELNGAKLHPAHVSKLPVARFFASYNSVKEAKRICLQYGIDIVHDRADTGQVTGYLIAKKLRLPRVAEVNYNFLSYERKNSILIDNILYPVLQIIKKNWIKRVVASADKVTAVSKSLKQILIREGVDANKIYAIPNGADPVQWKPYDNERAKKELKINTNDIVVIQIGELGPRHGIVELIKVVSTLSKTYPNLRLYLIGGDKYPDYI